MGGPIKEKTQNTQTNQFPISAPALRQKQPVRECILRESPFPLPVCDFSLLTAPLTTLPFSSIIVPAGASLLAYRRYLKAEEATRAPAKEGKQKSGSGELLHLQLEVVVLFAPTSFQPSEHWILSAANGIQDNLPYEYKADVATFGGKPAVEIKCPPVEATGLFKQEPDRWDYSNMEKAVDEEIKLMVEAVEAHVREVGDRLG